MESTFVDGFVAESIAAVGKDETVALLWDAYLSDYPADPAIERALSVLDPNWRD